MCIHQRCRPPALFRTGTFRVCPLPITFQEIVISPIEEIASQAILFNIHFYNCLIIWRVDSYPLVPFRMYVFQNFPLHPQRAIQQIYPYYILTCSSFHEMHGFSTNCTFHRIFLLSSFRSSQVLHSCASVS